jgi:excisionase family DNA binding protein
MEPLLLRPQEAAAILGVSRAKFYPLMMSGVIPSFRLGGSRRIARADLEVVVERLRRGDTLDDLAREPYSAPIGK